MAGELAIEATAGRALEPALMELEARRRGVLTRAAWTIGLIIGALPLVLAPLGLLAWLGLELPEDSPGAAAQFEVRSLVVPYLDRIGIALFAAPVIWLFVAVWALRRFVWRAGLTYRAEYKDKAFAALCAQHFPQIRYEPDEGIGWRVLDDSGLFSFASDVYRSDDRFSGRYGATQICFAEAVAQRERRRGFGENRETVYETYFRG